MVLYTQSSQSQPPPLTGESDFASRRKLLSNYSRFVILVCIVTTGTLARAQEKPSAAPAGLLSALRSKDKGDRRDAANQLGVLRARGSLRALVEALSDKEASVREASAFALGQISDPAATGLLIPLLADPEPPVRASTAFALGMIADRKATEALSFATGDADLHASAVVNQYNERYHSLVWKISIPNLFALVVKNLVLRHLHLFQMRTQAHEFVLWDGKQNPILNGFSIPVGARQQ